MSPVTQLYVSVDAATKDSLKAIDRPLFGDFWERYIACLKVDMRLQLSTFVFKNVCQMLRQKRVRTVYRMTLVCQILLIFFQFESLLQVKNQGDQNGNMSDVCTLFRTGINA